MKYTLEWARNKFNESANNIEYIFFWGHHAKDKSIIDKRCLSQWWPCLFFVDGIKYQSAEHYMMAEKAFLFKDYEIREKILKSTDSKYAKELGRKVKGFREDVWKENCYEIVKRGNYEKFGQNEDLKNYLLSTNSKILVEASPVDLIWGIGIDENATDIKNPLVWRGTNLLGFILMEVRDDLELYMG